MNSKTTEKRTILWFRNDLRTTDHEPLHCAAQYQAPVLAVYCFDPRQFGQTAFGFPKTGPQRFDFIVQSVLDLQNRLKAIGVPLIIKVGKPEEVLPKLATTWNATDLYFHREVTSEELAVEQQVISALQSLPIQVRSFWGHTLYHLDNLPFKPDHMPDVFSDFRNTVEANTFIRSPLPEPLLIANEPCDISNDSIPLAFRPQTAENESIAPTPIIYAGGESAALERLKHYLWNTKALSQYKQTRNELHGLDFSSKFSLWLATGCISPRTIYHEIQQYEREVVKNDSTYWLIFELIWRDYFRFIAQKYGNRIFYRSGIKGIGLEWSQDESRFNAWANGQTGYPIIDANMRELKQSGYMSNRGRQIVASFLTKNLGLDWRMGAEWFESWLIDYDPCSNYGNWNYVASVGTDPRGFRYFHPIKQAQQHDPKGLYIKHWLPELKHIPLPLIYEPWTLNPNEQQKYRCLLNHDYPQPIVKLERSIEENERKYNDGLRKGNFKSSKSLLRKVITKSY
jgi:deoxyribodipyrimidine photo-lyase